MSDVLHQSSWSQSCSLVAACFNVSTPTSIEDSWMVSDNGCTAHVSSLSDVMLPSNFPALNSFNSLNSKRFFVMPEVDCITRRTRCKDIPQKTQHIKSNHHCCACAHALVRLLLLRPLLHTFTRSKILTQAVPQGLDCRISGKVLQRFAAFGNMTL